MTLIIGGGNRKFASQVSDRRLTRSDGSVFDDDSNKATIFICDDARFVVGFTGLAEIVGGTFKTQVWLRTALRDCSGPDFTANGMIERFSNRASVDFATLPELKALPPENKRVTFMFTGFLKDLSGPLLAIGFVTNFQDFEAGTDSAEAWPEFQRNLGQPRTGIANPTSVQRVGSYREIGHIEVEELRALLSAEKPPAAFVGKAVQLIRIASTRPSSSGVIGQQLMSAILPADFAAAGTFEYHPSEPSHVMYSPDIVVTGTGFGAAIMGDMRLKAEDPKGSPPLIVPKQRARTACRCKSGKMYKNCHGKGQWRK